MTGKCNATFLCAWVPLWCVGGDGEGRDDKSNTSVVDCVCVCVCVRACVCESACVRFCVRKCGSNLLSSSLNAGRDFRFRTSCIWSKMYSFLPPTLVRGCPYLCFFFFFRFTGDIAGQEVKSFEQVLRAYKVTQQTKGNNSARQTRDATTKTGIAYGNSTWRASKYKVY